MRSALVVEASTGDAARLVHFSPLGLRLMGDGACMEEGDFFQGWNPFPTAASARGGGLLLFILLHCAANMARGVPPMVNASCKDKKYVLTCKLRNTF